MSWRFFAISPGDGRDLSPWIEAMGGSVTDLVLREPTGDLAHPARLACTLGIEVWLHSCHPQALTLALAHRYGLHLPSQAPPTGHRHGRSCHDANELDRAFDQGAAYGFLSPVHRPTSKPSDSREPLGVDRFIALSAGRPVIALGGIDPARAHALREAGAHGVAVLGDLFDRAPAELAAYLQRYPLSELPGPSMMNSSGS